MRNAVFGLFLVGIIAANGWCQGFSYSRSGFGFDVGFVVVDDVNPVDAGFAFGGHGDIAFSLGRYGELHYYPALCLWMGSDDYYDNDLFAMEIDMNFFDVRYYFPVQINVRPFAGLGPMIAIEIADWDDPDPIPRRYDDDVDVSAGFNMFAGVEFLLSSTTNLNFEMRGKFGHWDIFRLMGGLTFRIR